MGSYFSKKKADSGSEVESEPEATGDQTVTSVGEEAKERSVPEAIDQLGQAELKDSVEQEPVVSSNGQADLGDDNTEDGSGVDEVEEEAEANGQPDTSDDVVIIEEKLTPITGHVNGNGHSEVADLENAANGNHHYSFNLSELAVHGSAMSGDLFEESNDSELKDNASQASGSDIGGRTSRGGRRSRGSPGRKKVPDEVKVKAKVDKIMSTLPPNSAYSPEQERPFLCQTGSCSSSFKQLYHLKRHHTSVHPDADVTPPKRSYAAVVAENRAAEQQYPVRSLQEQFNAQEESIVNL
ncbi:hypothetical protein HDE_06688 [Halotydeus destructor]|nr:hypothetical protein HDE_06688 [Halotydeus destructor]